MPRLPHEDYIGSAFRSLLTTAATPETRAFCEVTADNLLATFASKVISSKLDECRSKGRGGWWRTDECPLERLQVMLQQHLAEGDMRGVLVLSAMIYARQMADQPGACSPVIRERAAPAMAVAGD